MFRCLTPRTKIQRKKNVIESLLFITIIILSITLQMSFFYAKPNSLFNNDLSNNQTKNKSELSKKEGNTGKKTLNKESNDLEKESANNPIINYQGSSFNESTSYDRPSRSPPQINGVSQAGFEIQEYVKACL
ncbi:MAG: hypothetical protein ACFFDT_31015 [Candidatus Hodarchaeota archaeon]